MIIVMYIIMAIAGIYIHVAADMVLLSSIKFGRILSFATSDHVNATTSNEVMAILTLIIVRIRREEGDGRSLCLRSTYARTKRGNPRRRITAMDAAVCGPDSPSPRCIVTPGRVATHGMIVSARKRYPSDRARTPWE
jgi:hypothetical protein